MTNIALHFQFLIGGLVVKNLPANEGDTRDASLIPGLGRSPGGGNGNPLQYSCLENPTDRRTWRATAHGVARVRRDQTTTYSLTSSPLHVLCSLLIRALPVPFVE